MTPDRPRIGVIPHPDWDHINWYSEQELVRAAYMLIPRYHAIEEMTHRTTVLHHALRVQATSIHFSQMLLNLGVEIHQPKIIFLSDHHDDCEMVTGDIPTPVKTNATPEEREQIDGKEREAALLVEDLVAKPKFIPSFQVVVDEFREQRTIEARVVKFADKWDGLQEAVHEVVTGTNKDGFKQVIREYEPKFRDLREQNRDWQDIVSQIIGEAFFEFPDPESLSPKTIPQLSFRTPEDFIESLCQGNPVGFRYWLIFNRIAFGLDFLKQVFPGWMGAFPSNVLEDIERVRQGRPRKRASGLILPSTYIDPNEVDFGEPLLQMTIDDTLTEIDELAEVINRKTGAKPVGNEFRFTSPT